MMQILAKLKSSRTAAVIATFLVAGVLSGCVVEHGPGYVGVHRYHHDDD